MDILAIVAMIAVFYLLFIRPENKRKKQAENLRNSLKKGDRIVTIGGMVGKVVQVNDTTIVFETSEDRVRIELNKWGVQAVLSAPAPGSKKAAKVEEEPGTTPEDLQHNPDAVVETEAKADFDPEIK